MQRLAAQHSDRRIESGIRVFKILSWLGGGFGIAVFILAILSGTPITRGFILVVGLVISFLAFPVILGLTKRLDLIIVIGMLWVVLIIGVAAWNYGGYSASALPWLCAVPIFGSYYLRGPKLMLTLAATGLCFAFISALQFADHATSEPLKIGTNEIAYGASFALLLVYLSIVSYLFRSAEDNAGKLTVAALADAREARAKAEEANAAKSHFLASMSHELRTPLNALVGFSDFMRQKDQPAVSLEKFQEYSEDMYTSAKYLLGIVDDILEYTDMGIAKATVTLSDVELGGVVKEALKVVAYLPGADEITIESHVPETLPRLKGDERFLKQIVINLLTNAIKFTDKGGRVTISAERDRADSLKLVVSDTGTGISAEDLPKLTQPFFKASSSKRISCGALGLGLAITSELVELHEGELSIQSKVDVGTTITCTFPASRSVS